MLNLKGEELNEALAELQGKTHYEPEGSVYDRILSQLLLWSQYEQKKNVAEENYLLSRKLPNMATDDFLNSYINAKKAMMLLESRMVEALSYATTEEQDIILHQRWTTLAGSIMLDKAMTDRLEAALRALQGTSSPKEE